MLPPLQKLVPSVTALPTSLNHCAAKLLPVISNCYCSQFNYSPRRDPKNCSPLKYPLVEFCEAMFASSWKFHLLQFFSGPQRIIFQSLHIHHGFSEPCDQVYRKRLYSCGDRLGAQPTAVKTWFLFVRNGSMWSSRWFVFLLFSFSWVSTSRVFFNQSFQRLWWRTSPSKTSTTASPSSSRSALNLA